LGGIRVGGADGQGWQHGRYFIVEDRDRRARGRAEDVAVSRGEGERRRFTAFDVGVIDGRQGDGDRRLAIRNDDARGQGGVVGAAGRGAGGDVQIDGEIATETAGACDGEGAGVGAGLTG